MKISKVSKGNKEQIKKLKIESLKDSPKAFDTSYEEVIEWNDEKWESLYSDLLSPTTCISFLAHENDIPAGYIWVDVSWKKKKRHIAEIDVIYVSPEFRKQGLASNLFNALLEEIKMSFPEIVKIKLSVYEDQKEAISFYNKLGFKVCGKFEKELKYEDKYYTQFAMEMFI